MYIVWSAGHLPTWTFTHLDIYPPDICPSDIYLPDICPPGIN